MLAGQRKRITQTGTKMNAFPLSLSSTAGWAFLVLALAWAGPAVRNPGQRWPRPWAWWLLLGASLLCFRLPVIGLPYEIHPDESQLLAGAITLRHDPLFWRAIDGGTAGPLDYFAVLPAAYFPGVSAYVAARVIATVLVWGTLVAAAEAVVLLTACSRVRLAALPALLFAAFTSSPEFLPYSTEQVPALLVILAVYTMTRQELRPRPVNLWLTGLLLGAVPWAKLQAVPLAACLGLFLAGREFIAGRRRETLLLVVGAALPTVVALLVVAIFDQTEHLVVPYFLQNLLYTQTGRQSLRTVLAQFGDQAVTNGYLAAWLAGSLAFVLPLLPWLRSAPGRIQRLAAGFAALLALASACALAPGRPYSHYLHFLAGPLTLLCGVLLAAGWSGAPPSPGRDRRMLGWFALCLMVPLLALRLSSRPDPYAYYNHVLSQPGPAHQALAAQVRTLTQPGEALGVWGWRSSLYVETGLIQATRQAHTESLLIAGPSQSYYLRTYAEKLAAAPPPVFVDAVGPGNFRFEDRAVAHELMPFLRQWIAEHYILVSDQDGCRFYVRRDRPSAPPQVSGNRARGERL